MTQEGSWQFFKSSWMLDPVTGSWSSGAMAAKGNRTKRLSRSLGWGRVSLGVFKINLS